MKLFFAFVCVAFLSVFVSAVQMEKNLDGYGSIGGDYVQVTAQLSQGWNLIYGLPNPEWIEAGSSSIEYIYGLDYATKDYIRFYPEPERDKMGSASLRVDYMLMNTAFWVYSDASQSVTYTTLAAAPLGQRMMVRGWNLFGISPDLAGQSLNSIRGDCTFEGAYAYESKDNEGAWVRLDEAAMNSTYFLANNAGAGLAIRASNDCTLAGGSSSGAQPPSVPN